MTPDFSFSTALCYLNSEKKVARKGKDVMNNINPPETGNKRPFWATKKGKTMSVPKEFVFKGETYILKSEVLSFSIPEKASAFVIGECLLVETVTKYYSGRLVAITETEIVLADAGWVVDTGRYMNALQSGSFNEFEPITTGNVILSRGAIVAAMKIPTLPRDQK